MDNENAITILIIILVICGFWILGLYGEISSEKRMSNFYEKLSDSYEDSWMEEKQVCENRTAFLIDSFNIVVEQRDFWLNKTIMWAEYYDLGIPKNVSSTINIMFTDIPHCYKGKMPTEVSRCWVYSNEAIDIEDSDSYTWVTYETFKVVSVSTYGKW